MKFQKTNKPHLAVETEQYDHEEEQAGPHWGEGHGRHGLRVHDEHQTGTRRGDVPYQHVALVRHVAEEGEDDEAGEEGGERVDQGDYQRVPLKSCWVRC